MRLAALAQSDITDGAMGPPCLRNSSLMNEAGMRVEHSRYLACVVGWEQQEKRRSVFYA